MIKGFSMSTKNKIRNFIREQAQISLSDDLFTDDVDLLDYGYLDSFGTVALIEFIDSEFSVDLADADFYDQQLRTVSGISQTVEDRRTARP